MTLKIGISMRITNASSYEEKRDSLAHDWYIFFKEHFPDADLIALPNIGRDIQDKLLRMNLDGFILSGGNDIGDEPVRDQTEREVLRYAQHNKCPLLGVCRGMQMIVEAFGGVVKTGATDTHASVNHIIRLTKVPFPSFESPVAMVNSFHKNLVDDAGGLTVFARDDAGFIEGVYSKDKLLLGLMWHPERQLESKAENIQLMRNLFFGAK